MTNDSVVPASKKPIIALDCDGVLLDYHSQFAHIYEKTFGTKPAIVSPKAFHVSLFSLTNRTLRHKHCLFTGSYSIWRQFYF